METRAHHVLIGLFTLLVIGAAIALTLWFGKAGRETVYDSYDIVFNEAVSGLSRGSAVQFNGITVGDVNSLKLDPKDPRRVIARVRVSRAAPMRSDTHARLVFTSVTGLSVIRLSSGNNLNSPPLRAQGEQNVPVIIADPSPFAKLLTDGGELMYGVNDLMAQARNLLSSENVARINATLRNLEQTTGVVAAQREDIAQTLRQLAEASRQANVTMQAAAQVTNNANQLLDDHGRQTMISAQHAMASLERITQTTDRLLADNRAQLGSGMQGVAELGPTLVELRSVLASLRQITRRMEERPTDYLLGHEQAREFQP